jgi:predicted nucleic acid-binding protein
MTVAYFDSSALVKLVIDENGSDEAALLWDAADSVLTCRVAHSEVRAALAAARRSGRLDAEAHRQAKAGWEKLHQALRMVELTARLEKEAGDLAEKHALSGFDAIHLASALTISAIPVVVATWDGRLHQAAQATGLATMPGRL